MHDFDYSFLTHVTCYQNIRDFDIEMFFLESLTITSSIEAGVLKQQISKLI